MSCYVVHWGIIKVVPILRTIECYKHCSKVSILIFVCFLCTFTTKYNVTALYSLQQRKVLCYLPLSLHEWPIAPWPHVQFVKMRGKIPWDGWILIIDIYILCPWHKAGIVFNMSLICALQQNVFFFVVCGWLSDAEREKMPFSIWATLHRNANQSVWFLVFLHKSKTFTLIFLAFMFL